MNHIRGWKAASTRTSTYLYRKLDNLRVSIVSTKINCRLTVSHAGQVVRTLFGSIVCWKMFNRMIFSASEGNVPEF